MYQILTLWLPQSSSGVLSHFFTHLESLQTTLRKLFVSLDSWLDDPCSYCEQRDLQCGPCQTKQLPKGREGKWQWAAPCCCGHLPPSPPVLSPGMTRVQDDATRWLRCSLGTKLSYEEHLTTPIPQTEHIPFAFCVTSGPSSG
ncbi:unnamed protein product [Pipistrellus nathusii]|uniref:Uncharacterized protein n=1 Tax=Pipistrellus nathusii TaxID=59473 RepID=A0ABN9ZKQ8_PIPNA